MENKNNKNHKEEPKEEVPAPKTVTITEEEYQALKESYDRMLRVQADCDNIRKRLEKEKQEFVKFANEGIILELLKILDELEKAVEAAESKSENLDAFLKGVEMILSHLYEMLKGYGVKPLQAKGVIFDPHVHEALMQTEDNNLPEHTVVEELQKGYILNDRVIRTAKVKVSKKTGG